MKAILPKSNHIDFFTWTLVPKNKMAAIVYDNKIIMLSMVLFIFDWLDFDNCYFIQA